MASDNVDRLRRELEEYVKRIPPKINDGSYNQAVAFKGHVNAAKKVLAKRNPTETELHAAINQLYAYW